MNKHLVAKLLSMQDWRDKCCTFTLVAGCTPGIFVMLCSVKFVKSTAGGFTLQAVATFRKRFRIIIESCLTAAAT